MKRLSFAFSLLACLAAAIVAPSIGAEATTELVFNDVKAQTDEFMGYYTSIRLSPEQEAIKREALTPLPAPCCSENSAYTCCCPCNLSRSIWGLSAHLITERAATAETVRETVQEWIAFVNPDGYSGKVCSSRGGCPKPFENDGCGGMNPAHVSWPDAAS